MFFHLIKKKNSIFISLSLLFFSIIFFIIVINSYDKLIVRTTYNDFNYYWLKIISITAIIISIISFVLKAKTKINILLIFFSFFLTFFILEIVMNIYHLNKIKNTNEINVVKKIIPSY